MTKQRFILLALLVAALALFAAGCGGDDDDVNVLAVWTGAEGEAFQAVLDGFTEANPDVNVSYQSAQDPATVLSTSVEGGNPPDVAALPSPGIMADFAGRGALTPIDFARETIEENYADVWLDLGTVEGELYGLFFKGANKSTVWYNVDVFEGAGVEPAEDWETFLSNAETLAQSGTPAYSIGGADGWTLTDLFENIYLRTAGPDLYDQLATHEIPWTHESVTNALTEM
ncbi:MAG: extracellular solute-binding protein family 1, partial [Gaiellaceae bacterium]|nr:extracellular solute-binding protein family 1 [Gaiellaceae bacterium]